MSTRVPGTYTRRVNGRTLEWDQQTLIDASQGLPVQLVSIEGVGVLDSHMWCRSGDPRVSVRDIAEGVRRFWQFQVTDVPHSALIIEHSEWIRDADLTWPIILGADGVLMDGAHRVAKALLTAQSEIASRRFIVEPPHDRER